MTFGLADTRRALVSAVFAAIASTCAVTAASGHPHVFAEARLEVTGTDDGMVDRLRHVWRFDPVFSATVLYEFDQNGDGSLDAGEREEVADTISTSIADFGYFQSITVGGTDIAVAEVTDMRVDMVDDLMLVLFTSRPVRPVRFADNPSFSVYDPTFYTAIDFYTDENMALIGAPDGCAHHMIVPDPDEAVAQNQDTLTDSFFNDPEGNDWTKIFATRMEVTCTSAGGATAAEDAGPARQRASGAPSSIGIGLAEQSLGPTSGPMSGLFGWIAQQQSTFYRLMTDALTRMRDGGAGAWILVGLSFLYGVLHAAGPGHGKVVISSYMVANETALRRGIALSFAASVVQALSAIVIVGLGFLVLRQMAISQTDTTRFFELASYSLVVLLGVWLLVRKVQPFVRQRQRQRPRPAALGAAAVDDRIRDGHHNPADHHEHHHHGGGEVCSTCGHAHMPTADRVSGPMDWRGAFALVISVGLRPCTGALVVLTFAFLNGLWMAGLVSVFAMALGTAITVSVLAILAVTAKNLALRVSGTTALSGRVSAGIEIAGALFIIVIGLSLLGGAASAS